ncbi:MAG: FRG domain-containing protein [Planctomycetota bacterium]|nr:FRG domain-containing protein [Planctomycetota bacterium]
MIAEIRKQHGTQTISPANGSDYTKSHRVLFRGQSDSKWDLKTTLERKTQDRFSVENYLADATHCVNEIESLTGIRWDIPDLPTLIGEITDTQDSMRVHLPSYAYLVYLRHHGFPSPLLDWTESPYIAAYFASCDDAKADRIAVYAYVETPTGAKAKTGGHPMISVQGPHVSTHSRHFVQKAWYTIATEWSYDDSRHYFCPHSRIFERNRHSQDVLVKITLPAEERRRILRELNDFNINHFTLFQSEDSLVRAMATKLFDLDDG